MKRRLDEVKKLQKLAGILKENENEAQYSQEDIVANIVKTLEPKPDPYQNFYGNDNKPAEQTKLYSAGEFDSDNDTFTRPLPGFFDDEIGADSADQIGAVVVGKADGRIAYWILDMEGSGNEYGYPDGYLANTLIDKI